MSCVTLLTLLFFLTLVLIHLVSRSRIGTSLKVAAILPLVLELVLQVAALTYCYWTTL